MGEKTKPRPGMAAAKAPPRDISVGGWCNTAVLSLMWEAETQPSSTYVVDDDVHNAFRLVGRTTRVPETSCGHFAKDRAAPRSPAQARDR